MRRTLTLEAALCSALALLGAAGALAAQEGAPRGGQGTAAHPYPLGAMAPIPRSGGWQARVDSTAPDAAAVIATIPLNKPPKPGYQYFLVELTFRYTGKGASKIIDRLAFYAQSAGGRLYDLGLLRNACGLVPDVLDDMKKVRAGGSVSGPLCVAVRKRDAAGLLFVVEPSTIAPHSVQVFFRTHHS